MEKQVLDLEKKLNEKGFKACHVKNKDEAKRKVLELVSTAQSVGIGGSVTVQELGLAEALQEKGQDVYWHWLKPEDKDQQRKMANQSDAYLCSSNAVTQDGIFVNTDGTGNRVSAMFYGPDQVVLICGQNKIVPTLDAAWDRIRNVACPANARRLKLRTPCAATGKCEDCDSPQRMCNVTTYLERPTHGKTVHVILVGQSLGY